MPKVKVGQQIGIPCEVKPGPFTGERLISVEAVEGIVSGFVQESELKEKDGQWFVRGQVLEVKDDLIQVWIEGSFFTTNGLATIPQEMAMAA
jgi:hypothetical protein